MGNFKSMPVKTTEVYNPNAPQEDIPWVIVGEIPSNKLILSINNLGQTRLEFDDDNEEEGEEGEG
jgi:hypothetical protein